MSDTGTITAALLAYDRDLSAAIDNWHGDVAKIEDDFINAFDAVKAARKWLLSEAETRYRKNRDEIRTAYHNALAGENA